MESWSYISGGKGFVSEESVSLDDGIARGKNGWELNPPCSIRNYYVGGIENQDFAELGSQDLMRKSLPNNQISSKLCGGRAFVSVKSAFSGEDESSSKHSSSIVESNSLIDLKLGRFPDAQSFRSPKIMQNLSFNVTALPARRNRAGGLSSQTPFCQVQGCGKDLSCSKDYHKRHKVCEVHSKTAKVIVKGIEQRFCQQCSRFHVLAEFDDGKRSCRKRLAGHNERRRKPQTPLHSGRAVRLFQSYAGTSSFVCQDILGCSLLHQPKLDTNGWCKNIKVEQGSDYSPQLNMPFTNGHSQSRPLFTSYHSEKHCPAPHFEGMTAAARNKNNESSNSYVNGMVGGSDFVSRSLLHSNSIGSQVLNVMDPSSTFGCALSLLSSQSQDSTNYSCGVPQFPLKGSTSTVSSIFNSAEDRLEQILSNNCGINGSIQGSEYVNTKNILSCEDGPTIDLLQLSSQLHQVEHQRQTLHEMK